MKLQIPFKWRHFEKRNNPVECSLVSSIHTELQGFGRNDAGTEIRSGPYDDIRFVQLSEADVEMIRDYEYDAERTNQGNN